MRAYIDEIGERLTEVRFQLITSHEWEQPRSRTHLRRRIIRKYLPSGDQRPRGRTEL